MKNKNKNNDSVLKSTFLTTKLGARMSLVLFPLTPSRDWSITIFLRLKDNHVLENGE
jgi:hypothetical protein